jgi:hypothetical protein
MGMESAIDPKEDMTIPGDYAPGPVGAQGLKPGVKPADLK